MKNLFLLALTIFFNIHFLFGQEVPAPKSYENLVKLKAVSQKIYHSKGSELRAKTITETFIDAEIYFKKQFKVKPEYTLLILNPEDWKTFAHPNAIYGIPHFLPDGRLVVAAENNDFWRRNIPPLDKLPKEIADQIRNTYTDENGEVNLKAFFDLLAIHELGHAFQKAAEMEKQRSWLSELLCNLLLHTYVAEKNPELLTTLTTFPQMTVNAMDASNLTYTTLEDFESKYNEIAQKHPDNYGWYQCQFHVAAGEIYVLGGEKAMNDLWDALINQKEKLDDKALTELLSTKSPELKQIMLDWNKKITN